MKNCIPVLYYHSVANHSSIHPWSFLSCPTNVFISQMQYLKSRGYYTCTYDELYAHITGERKLPRNSVMIHFDDGFLDNWSVVFPIMKELNLKYIVLLSPEFIENSNICRKFLTDTTENNKSEWWGYLNSAEIKQMNESGLVDFQAHGYTHTWYENSSKIIDIYNPKSFYPHIIWNSNRNNKPKWLTLNLSKEILGTPIFEYEKSLSNEKRFIPNSEFMDEAKNIYDVNIGFEDNRKNILSLYNRYKKENILGRWENSDERLIRWKQELHGAKYFLEKLLSKQIDYMVFPGGGNNIEVIELAKNAGYKLISKGQQFNQFNSNIFQISRLAGYHKFRYMNASMNRLFFKAQIQRGKGDAVLNNIIKILK